MSTVAQLRHAVGRTLRNLRRNRVGGVGHDFVGDVKTRLPHVQIQMVFDVGAHIGMTALEFSDEFPKAIVHAFEPHPENFIRMKSNLVGKPEVRCHAVGMSDKPGRAAFEYDPEHPSMARISGKGSETIELGTVDRFSTDNGVTQIDLLKIDVEGHELPVLAGARQMLSADRIAIIKLETAIDPDMSYHTQLFEICGFLHPLGYRLFGIYDQWENTLADSPRLRRFDAAFISPTAQDRR